MYLELLVIVSTVKACILTRNGQTRMLVCCDLVLKAGVSRLDS